MEPVESESAIIYQERYATWRHLDEMRYQVIGLSLTLILIASGFLSIIEDRSWLIVLVLGISLIFTSSILGQINSAIVRNGQVLDHFAQIIGDSSIPSAQNRLRSRVNWFQYALFLAGCMLIGASLGGFVREIEVGLI